MPFCEAGKESADVTDRQSLTFLNNSYLVVELTFFFIKGQDVIFELISWHGVLVSRQ